MEIRNTKELHAAIAVLENKKSLHKELLVEHFHEAYEHFKPLNLIKNAISDINFSTESLGGTLASAAISTGAGLLSKKIFIGRSNNIFKRLLGLAIELGVAHLVAKNSDEIKEKAAKLFDKFIKRNKESEE